MKLLRLYLRLINTKGLGAKKVKNLISHIGSLEDFSETKASEVLGRELAKGVSEALRRKWIYEEEVLEILRKHDIKAVMLEEELYPKSLRAIDDSPPILFYKGELPKEGIGIVGTRNPSEISLKVVEKLVKEKGKDVISGGARGIDLEAHTQALKNGFKTFVVLGAGILRASFEVKKLFEESREKVSLISEFLPFQRASRYTFPRRNRIIAAFSEEIFVIEAGKRSGSLITARYAVKYKKPLYAYVGDESSDRWEGCLSLIKSGLAKRYEPKEQRGENELLNFLKKPRTYDEVAVFLGLSKPEVLKILSKLMIEGLVKKEGAHYVSF